MSTVSLHLLMKHSMSTLPDLAVQVEIDRPGRLVTFGADSIDSALLLDLIFYILPKEHEVVAFTDYSTGLTPPAPPFGLRIRFDGRYLRAHASKLITGSFELRLEGAAVERMRMALESAPRVLEALHDAGYRAIVHGSVGRGGKGHAKSDLDVFVFGEFDEIGPVSKIADQASSVPVDLALNWVTKLDPADFVMERHLAWDPVAKQCVSVAGTLEKDS